MIAEIIQAANRFRMALDQVSSQTWSSVTVDEFPRGACGHASELLARYLESELGIHATYASGSIRHIAKGETHAWLEWEGLIIDITADQFDLPKVIVAQESDFHSQAREVERHPIIRDGWWATYAQPVWQEAQGLLDQ